MDYLSFYEKLNNAKMISPVWEHVLSLIHDELKDKEHINEYLILFAIFFSLVDEGNICMSLDKETLFDKWLSKVESAKVSLEDIDEFNDKLFKEIKDESFSVIDDYLSSINQYELGEIIGENRLFFINNDYIYIKKYFDARKSIIHSINRIFKQPIKSLTIQDNIVNHTKEGFNLTERQNQIVEDGINRSLIITGGPGTGKTTSILFLLLNLLSLEDEDKYHIYLTAPSGKASRRMKESIIGSFSQLKQDYIDSHEELVNRIKELDGSTIHRLLQYNGGSNTFIYNKNHPFPSHSIFIIDESSMIDICLFASLLDAIPNDAKVYIMGDKNQLPSVEAGAVFAELLNQESLTNNIIELDESVRFSKDTIIYDLAKAVNEGSSLPIKEQDFKDYKDFAIEPNDIENNKRKPVFYYLNESEGVKERDIIKSLINKWGEKYYSYLQDLATDIDVNDIDSLDKLFTLTEVAKVLTAENEGVRGVKSINELVVSKYIDRSKYNSTCGHYPGELMMINKNNKLLDLYNGDSGILVTFKNDKNLYFMIKSASLLVREDGKQEDKIFKIKDYMFYPLRLIKKDEIDLAYAITIHKSQGMDYKNILVILPSKKGHPLLNRQIVYTAITRTKGNTYILSNLKRLSEAKDTIIVRDTNLDL